MKLRLILGDQLNIHHSWFKEINKEVIYVMFELQQEQNYVTHHIQKIVAFFVAMRAFANQLKKDGHQIIYYKINQPENEGALNTMLHKIIAEHKISAFEYQYPDEYRLDEQLKEICHSLSIETTAVDTEHFLTSRTALGDFFEGKKTYVMEPFYRNMRKKLNLLMDQGEPLGGSWNYDQENRKSFDHKVPLPPIHFHLKKVNEVKEEIDAAGIHYFGNIEVNAFNWPSNREEALADFQQFLSTRLKHFGTYEDAMLMQHTVLFHSRISFALNCKLVHPLEIAEQSIRYREEHPEEISIPQIEGFIRQVIGWREYVRGIYWKHMPAYKKLNYLKASRPLPSWYWTGNTKMNCMKNCLGNSLDNAYAHHIQRLMVIGNFSLLAGLDPDQVDEWYLGVYADAIEWVELPNTRGMSQFADGGIMGTKPYVSSANYISKMSNYCKTCSYSSKEKTSDHACPFNSLYWNFYETHRSKFQSNPRVGMVYRLLDKMKEEEKHALFSKAKMILENIEAL